jgi:hypothetical protein
LGFARHIAGCKPAIQQLEKLRYGRAGTSAKQYARPSPASGTVSLRGLSVKVQAGSQNPFER